MPKLVLLVGFSPKLYLKYLNGPDFVFRETPVLTILQFAREISEVPRIVVLDLFEIENPDLRKDDGDMAFISAARRLIAGLKIIWPKTVFMVFNALREPSEDRVIRLANAGQITPHELQATIKENDRIYP